MRGLRVGCVVLGIQALWACAGVDGDAGSRAEAQSAPAAAAATTPAQKLLAAYLNVQRRLAADDAKGAKAAFVQLKAASEVKELPGDPALRQKLVAAAGSGANAKDIDAARDAFGKSSEGLLEWLKKEGNTLATSVRVAHCPMARDGKGGRWVQTETKVSNPYYGSEMLECGSIEKELKPGSKL
jgi:membrane fusion protein, copper/silver efflux system